MTFENTFYTDPSVRPGRVRVLAEIPRNVFDAIAGELHTIPDWDRYFIMNNPSGWPMGMFEVISKHLTQVTASSLH